MEELMKSILLAVLFAPMLYTALREKKWYLYLMVGLTAVLPEQFSVRIHESIPLITASRVLIMIAALFWIVERIRRRNFSIPVSLAIYLGVFLGVSLIHFPSNSSEINSIFLIVCERGLVVLLLVDTISGKEGLNKCIDMLILGACIMAVVGISQTVFNFDMAKVLHLLETPTSISLKPRMGLTRAFATFNALTFGSYCSVMALPIYYRMEQTGKKRYSVAFALNIVALIATFSRIVGCAFLKLAHCCCSPTPSECSAHSCRVLW